MESKHIKTKGKIKKGMEDMKKTNYWKCASGMVIIATSFLYSMIFLIVNKLTLGMFFGILMIIGLIIFALNYDGEFCYY